MRAARRCFPWGGFENETGEGPGRGYNVNVPLPAETYDEAFLTAFDRVVMPLVEAFHPDVMVLELGMDTLAGDPLTHLRLTNNVVVEIFERLLRFQFPILVEGGGGYHVENTVRGWALAWQTCCGGGAGGRFKPRHGRRDARQHGMGGGAAGPGLAVTTEQRRAVESELHTTIETVISNVFRHHGLGRISPWAAVQPPGDRGGRPVPRKCKTKPRTRSNPDKKTNRL